MGPPDIAKHRIRSKFEAFVLDSGQTSMHKHFGDRKAAAIGAMSGTVVQIGPGTGVNMRYYSPGVRLIGIEPNSVMHHRLRTKATSAGVDLTIRTLRGESVDVADEAAEGVVGTLVLCGVEDPSAVLNEVTRVLRPGGTYFFLEHVAASAGSRTRALQRAVKRPHRWLFNGCEVDRTTQDTIAAAGFSHVNIDHVDIGLGGGYVRNFIVGTAIRS